MSYDPALIVKHISTGCHGNVFKARDIIDEKDVAMKRYPGDKAIKCIARGGFAPRTEVDIIQRIEHPNIISISKVSVNDKGLYFTMDLAIASLEKSVNSPITEKLRISYCEQLLSAFDFLNRNSILHCDLKCDNILVFGESIKLCDFGNAFCCEERPLESLKFIGPQVTKAPELTSIRKIHIYHSTYKHKYPTKGDRLESIVKGSYYSLGVILYFILKWVNEEDYVRYRSLLELSEKDSDSRSAELVSLLSTECSSYIQPLTYLLSDNPSDRVIGYNMLSIRKEGTLKYPGLMDPLIDSYRGIYHCFIGIVKKAYILKYSLVRLDMSLSLMVKCFQYSLNYRSPYLIEITPSMITSMVIYTSLFLTYFNHNSIGFDLSTITLGKHKQYHKRFIEDFYRDHNGVVTYDRLGRHITSSTLLCLCFPYYLNVNQDMSEYIYSKIIPDDVHIMTGGIHEPFDLREVLELIKMGL